MENSQQPLATESFSYSWLLNRKPSIDSLTESLTPSYITDEEDIMFIAYSKRFLEEAQNFNFDVRPSVESVPADEIFSDGHIMPLYFDRSKIESFEEALNNSNTCSISSSTPPTPISTLSSRTSQAEFLEKWRKFSGRVLVKWFGFFRPFAKRIASSRKSAKVDDLQRKESEIQSCKSTNSLFQESPRRMVKSYSVVDWAGNENNQRNTSRIKRLRKVKSWSNSAHASPIRNPSSDHNSTDVWRDMENAVSDAILHCKRSFAMSTESDDHFDQKKKW
ncbi:putative membrane-associated kinase regulator 6 [Nicotiana tabacum]|uniref:Membrane-associated kinase regulator 6 n=2 Tax=Nicotiana TaxID=4085 RepID=A0A1S4BTS1_TOBAC|nr:PREDICTED: probable membrane-associated kinase regulator 6 [Nicotiana sylvestris]XP_016492223.1 PREDICTED: probable membrane-associated kinase regulator 6 [Nicotiana tabacum]